MHAQTESCESKSMILLKACLQTVVYTLGMLTTPLAYERFADSKSQFQLLS
jgi:hypothetical protein